MSSPAENLRELLNMPGVLLMAGCHDAISAKQVEVMGFSATFMSGFAVSAARLGLPDTGLISYGELVDQGRAICQAVKIPVFGDGDTGFGNAINVQRTVRGYADAGFACIMIEYGKTPVLPLSELEAIGYKIAVYPLTLLNVSIRAMREALTSLKQGNRPKGLLDFETLKSAVGFSEYYQEEERYKF